MKPLSTILVVLLLCLTATVAFTQTNSRPKIFANYPEAVDCATSQLSNAFAAKEGDNITFSFSGNLNITGTVLSNVQKYDNLQSMTIRSATFANAVFQLSKQTNSDNTYSYVGRIMSNEASDGYEIKNDVTGKYTLHKIDQDKILQLCNQ